MLVAIAVAIRNLLCGNGRNRHVSKLAELNSRRKFSLRVKRLGYYIAWLREVGLWAYLGGDKGSRVCPMVLRVGLGGIWQLEVCLLWKRGGAGWYKNRWGVLIMRRQEQIFASLRILIIKLATYAMKKSISEYFYSPNGPEGHKCGYCKSPDTSTSHGMWTHSLTVEDYQDLIDRGWRRSGKYCYKPVMSKTCCPMYTISCQATKFRLSKSQKIVLKKMTKYLVKTEPGAGPDCTDSATVAAAKAKQPVQPGKGADPSKPPCRKAKLLRKERKEKKLCSDATASISASEAKTVGKGDPLEITKPVNSDTNFVKTGPDATASMNASEATKEKTIGKGDLTKPVNSDTVPDFMKTGPDGRKSLEEFLSLPSSKPGVESAHRLEMKLVRSSPPSSEFVATFSESYSIFRKYQMSIHKEAKEDCKESQYRRFLCDSPLVPRKGQEGWPCDYGSYHQQYRIDGKLVAVGVIDILPKCLSSVYVFYDPDSDFLSLGVYSALREIEMTRKLHCSDPETFKYYYMGYYIHSCQKMRYKGNYTPSFLLCPESYNFVLIEKCRPKLELTKYSRLNDQESVPEDVSSWLGDTLILVRQMQTYMSYSQFCSFLSGNEQEAKVRKYAELVGPRVASRMLLVA